MSQGSVIQGNFPHGIAHLNQAQRAPLQPMMARPAWVQQRIGAAPNRPSTAQPSTAQPARVHASANGSSVQLPAHLAGFAPRGGGVGRRQANSRLDRGR